MKFIKSEYIGDNGDGIICENEFSVRCGFLWLFRKTIKRKMFLRNFRPHPNFMSFSFFPKFLDTGEISDNDGIAEAMKLEYRLRNK